MKNPHARALGKLGKGKPKTITQAERHRRAERLARAREKRWEPKLTNQESRKAGNKSQLDKNPFV